MNDDDQQLESEPQVYIDDARAVEALNRLLQGKAMMPPKNSEKRLISAKLSEAAITGLKHVAKELGYVHGGSGNVSMLLEAIGTQTLRVTQPSLQARRLN